MERITLIMRTTVVNVSIARSQAHHDRAPSLDLSNRNMHCNREFPAIGESRGDRSETQGGSQEQEKLFEEISCPGTPTEGILIGTLWWTPGQAAEWAKDFDTVARELGSCRVSEPTGTIFDQSATAATFRKCAN